MIGCLLVLVMTACGGGEAAPAATEAPGTSAGAAPTTTAGSAAEPVATTIAADPDEVTEEPNDVVEESLATVTIGDETWEFRPTGFLTERCDTDFFGGYWVLMSSGVGILLPGENWEELGVDQTPNIRVKIEESGLEFIADPDTNLPGVEPGMSQIDSFVIDGARASGTATFVEEEAAFQGNAEPLTGSFEVVCAPEEE